MYSCERIDDSWTNWSSPVNAGDKINSSGRELYYRIAPAVGAVIYTSTINSDGYGDIKLFVPDTPLFPQQDSVVVVQHPADTPVVAAATDPAADKTGRIKIYGKVHNTKTQEPVQATIAFVGPDQTPHSTSSGESGYSSAAVSLTEYSCT